VSRSAGFSVFFLGHDMGGNDARDIAPNDIGHPQRNALRRGEKPVTGLAVIPTRVLQKNAMGLVEGFDSKGKGNVAPFNIGR